MALDPQFRNPAPAGKRRVDPCAQAMRTRSMGWWVAAAVAGLAVAGALYINIQHGRPAPVAAMTDQSQAQIDYSAAAAEAQIAAAEAMAYAQEAAEGAARINRMAGARAAEAANALAPVGSVGISQQ